MHTPSTTMTNTTTPRQVGQGRVALEGHVAGGAAVDANFSVVGGGAKVRYGVLETVEVEGEAHGYQLAPGDSILAKEDASGVFGARAGLKYTPKRAARIFAITAGFGGGYWRGGGFMSPDLGLTLGYENPFFVPFANLRVGLNLPVAADELAFEDESGSVVLATTTDTLQVLYGLGFKMPFLASSDRNGKDDSAGARRVGLYFTAVLNLGHLYSLEEPEVDSAERSAFLVLGGGNIGMSF